MVKDRLMRIESEDAPKSISDYTKWLRDARQIEITPATKTHYRSVVLQFRDDFERSTFWTRLITDLPEHDAEYQMRTSYPLLMNSQQGPTISTKEFDAFFLKTFRKNVLTNNNWPDPPPGGWLLPDDWFQQVNDLVRTNLVVKYLDGVEFLAEKVVALASELKLTCNMDFEAKEEGYYAAHVYVRVRSIVPGLDWRTSEMHPHVEIQVTTQLQDVIRRLLHRYYEERREQPAQSAKWQWDYRTDEFTTNYLGHILHYVEGMIMDIREKQSIQESLTRKL
jgi:hypothetical protein